MSANVRHSSGSPQWGTPREVIEIARAVLKPMRESDEAAIDVDPFSEPEFNARVGARRVLTGATGLDGFIDRWLDHDECPRADHLLAGIATEPAPALFAEENFSAIINPPGDETGDSVKRAWRIAEAYHRLGWFDSVLWVAFNLNQLQTLQGEGPRSPLSEEFIFFRCVPDHRLDFARHSSQPPSKHGDAPSHPMFFCLLGSHTPVVKAEQLRLFDSMGSKLGQVF